jgi:predicted amidohydrolase
MNLASLQLDASPAPLLERLERAEKLVASAADQGAELMLLPELFNTGYAYNDRNYQLAESLDGPTPN